MKTVNKTLIAVLVASACINCAYAASTAQDLYTDIAVEHMKYSDFKETWSHLTLAQQQEFYAIETQNHTAYASDLGEAAGQHSLYTHSNPQAVAQYNPPTVKPVYSGASQRPGTQQDIPTPHLDGMHQDIPTPHLDGMHSGNPAHVTATQRPDIDHSQHLDGTHQDIPTPHLDGMHSGNPAHVTATQRPDIDPSQHLDSNATVLQRQNAQWSAAIQQTRTNADNLKGLQLEEANRQRTANQHVTPVVGHDGAAGKEGVDGKEGVNGKDGVTTTIARVQVDRKTQSQVADNASHLRHVQEQQTAQGEYVQQMNQTVSHNAMLSAGNSQRLDSVESRQTSLEQQQSDDRKEYRSGIAGAVAVSGLHYTETDNSVAVGAGDFKNEQGYALGYRHKFSQNVAATVAASETSNGDALYSASAAIGW